MPLPKVITDEFQQKIPSSIFTSNPCRIQYCTQEIVIIREDLVTKMCRNTIHFPTSGEIPEHVSIKIHVTCSWYHFKYPTFLCYKCYCVYSRNMWIWKIHVLSVLCCATQNDCDVVDSSYQAIWSVIPGVTDDSKWYTIRSNLITYCKVTIAHSHLIAVLIQATDY